MAAGAALVVTGGVTLGFPISTMMVGATPNLTVTPSTGLKAGDVVQVSGSGFTPNSTGAILECNSDTHQPTISFLGNNVPVSCTSPLNKIVSTDGSGNVPTTSFTIVVGTTGPPTTGTDSSGHDATADAANFPCPPTAAQIAAGDTCIIAFGDQAMDMATMAIMFAGGGSTTTTSPPTIPSTTPPTIPGSRTVTQGVGVVVSSSTTTTPTTRTTSPAPTTSTAPPTTSAAAKGALARTGADATALWAVVAGFVLLDLGYLALSITRRPRWARQLISTKSSAVPPDQAPRQ
jgi:hypothetical protein